MSYNDLQSVWKFPLEIVGEQELEVPYGATFLSLIAQNDLPTLYAQVDPDTDLKEKWCIYIRGTGHTIGREMTGASLFIGTISTHGGDLVWHVWRRVLSSPVVDKEGDKEEIV